MTSPDGTITIRVNRSDFEALTDHQRRDHLRSQGLDVRDMSCREEGEQLVYRGVRLTNVDGKMPIAGDAMRCEADKTVFMRRDSDEAETPVSGPEIGIGESGR